MQMPFVLQAEDRISAIAYIHYHWPECTQYKPFAYHGFSDGRMRHLARQLYRANVKEVFNRSGDAAAMQRREATTAR